MIVTKADTEGDEVLCYNTKTTALIALDKFTYDRIFKKMEFCGDELKQLKKMGFILDDDFDEIKDIERKRQEFLASEDQALTIITTTDCNARCYYCFEAGIKRYSMTRETADALVDFCKKNFRKKELRLSWFGGEPLMNFDIITYLTERFLSCGYTIRGHITTNGSLLRQEIIEYCLGKYEHFSCQITIDDLYDDYWAVKRYVDLPKEKAFNTVIQNVILLLQNDVETAVRINFKASKFDHAKAVFQELNALLSKYNKNGKLYIYFAPLNISDTNEIISDFHCSYTHPYLQMVETQNGAGYFVDEQRFMSSINKMAAYGLMPTCGSCGMTNKNKFAVDADGSLYKCHRLVGRKEFCCGNVSDGIDEENWCYRYYRSSKISDPHCANCNILPVCQEGCKARRLLLGDKFKCSNISQVKEDLVRIFYKEMTGGDKA